MSTALRPARPPADATTLLTVLVVLLVGLPSRLVFKPLGAAGTPAEVFGLALILLWASTRMVPALGVARGLQPIRVVLAIFGVAVVVSYVEGAARPISHEEISSADRGLLSLLAWSGMALVAADGVRCRERLETLLRRLVYAGVFLALTGICQFATGANPIGTLHLPGLAVNAPFGLADERSDFRRVNGTALHPIEFGVVLCLILPLALHFALTARPGKRLGPWLCVAAIGIALPMAVARSAIVGLIVVLAMLFPVWTPRQRRRTLLALPFVVVGLRLLVPGLVGTIGSLFSNVQNDPSTTGRTTDYAAVAHYVSGAPIFGRGWGTFIPSIYRTLDNQYLGTVVEAGLVGLFALFGLLLTGLFTARGARRAGVDPATRHLGQALAASCGAAFVSFGTFDALSFPMCAAVLFLLLGCAGALWRLTVPAPAPVPAAGPQPRPGLVKAGALVVVVLLAGPVALVLRSGTREFAADAAVLLLPGDQTNSNPYARSGSAQVLTEIMKINLLSRASHATVQARGGTGDYEVGQGDESTVPFTDIPGDGPVLHLVALSPDPDVATRTRAVLLRYVADIMADQQNQLRLPAKIQISPLLVSAPPDLGVRTGSSKRALAGLLLLAAVAWWLLVRAGMRCGSAVLGPTPTPTPTPAQAAVAS